MPRSSVVELLSLMVFTILCGTMAWGRGEVFFQHDRGFIVKQKALAWQGLLALCAIELLHELTNVALSRGTYPLLQWLFMGGAVATGVHCFKNRIHFDQDPMRKTRPNICLIDS